VYHPLLRWVVPLLLLVAIAVVWYDHRRREHVTRKDPHHPVHHPRNHVTAAGVLATIIIFSFIASFMIP